MAVMIRVTEVHCAKTVFAYFPVLMNNGKWKWLSKYRLVTRKVTANGFFQYYEAKVYERYTNEDFLFHDLSGIFYFDNSNPWEYYIEIAQDECDG